MMVLMIIDSYPFYTAVCAYFDANFVASCCRPCSGCLAFVTFSPTMKSSVFCLPPCAEIIWFVICAKILSFSSLALMSARWTPWVLSVLSVIFVHKFDDQWLIVNTYRDHKKAASFCLIAYIFKIHQLISIFFGTCVQHECLEYICRLRFYFLCCYMMLN